MKRALYSAIVATIVAPICAQAAAGLSAPPLTVGRNLQTAGSIVLPRPAPDEGLQLTVTSSNPELATFAAQHEQAGSARIVLSVKPRAMVTPDFWVHGMADSGEARYTIEAPGMGSAQGVVKLGPSGIAIVGPFRLPSFPTTPRSPASRLTVVSALLDASGKIVGEQEVAGGLAVEVVIANSSPESGALDNSTLKIPGGSSTASALFKPSATGSTTLTPTPPKGFATPAEMGKVTAVVDKPGLAITDDFTVGKDLQMLGVLCLGEAAPEGGLEVTLTSSDPKKMVFSAREDERGSGVLVLRVPAGALTAQYYLQALGDSGSITYRATAAGFRHRIAKIALAPSGFIVAYERYGPPDRAAVQRAGAAKSDERRFYAKVGEDKDKPVRVTVYSVYLDPESRLAADITVQPLRAGVSATVALTSSNPAVATVESPLKIEAGTNRAYARFTPLAAGETVISVRPPAGFSVPANAASAPATVMP